MEVAAEDGRFVGTCGIGIVGDGEGVVGGEAEGFIFNADVKVGRWITGGAVVVAAHEDDVEGRVLGPPSAEGGEDRFGSTGAGVEKIAGDDEVVGGEALDEVGEDAKIGVDHFGDGNSGGAEGRGFAEVEVGNDEHPPTHLCIGAHGRGSGAAPEHSALGQEVEGLAVPVDRQHQPRA